MTIEIDIMDSQRQCVGEFTYLAAGRLRIASGTRLSYITLIQKITGGIAQEVESAFVSSLL